LRIFQATFNTTNADAIRGGYGAGEQEPFVQLTLKGFEPAKEEESRLESCVVLALG
jgi:hypothetical protein